ncbi:MAG: SH3 domain-containing protein [Bacteroidia bacterium]
MKTKLFLLTISAIFNIFLLRGADNYQVGSELYVWAKSGLNIREIPDISGKKIGKLNLGEWVKVISISNKKSDIQVIAPRPDLFSTNIYQDSGATAPYYLTGRWIEVRSEKFKGFVVDMYLLKYPPPSTELTMIDYIKTLASEPCTIDTSWVDEDSGSDKKYFDYKSNADTGFGFSGHNFMESVGQTVRIPDMTVEEGFVFCNFFYPLEDAERAKSKDTPLKLMGYEKDNLWMMQSDICEIGISIEENHLYIYMGCSC